MDRRTLTRRGSASRSGWTTRASAAATDRCAGVGAKRVNEIVRGGAYHREGRLPAGAGRRHPCGLLTALRDAYRADLTRLSDAEQLQADADGGDE